MLIKNEDIYRNENGELQMEKMLEYTIRNTESKVIEDGSLHYQSIFNIENSNEFEYSNYFLTVPFGTFSANDPIKMNPIKIELN